MAMSNEGAYRDADGNSYRINADGTLEKINDARVFEDDAREQIKNVAAEEAKKGIFDYAKNKIGDGLSSIGLGDIFGYNSPGAAISDGYPVASNWDGSVLTTNSPEVMPGASNPIGGTQYPGRLPIGMLGAYGLLNLAQNRQRIGTREGYLQGAASGAAIGYGLGGPVGAGAGATLGIIGNALSLGGESRTREEEIKRDALRDQYGVSIPNADIKEWENNEKFRESRNEADLTGKDIIHAADFYQYIPGWNDLDDARKEAIASKALELGLIREKKGSIYLSWNNPDFKKFSEDALKAYQDEKAKPQRDKMAADARAARARDRASAAMGLMSSLRPNLSAPYRYDQERSGLINNPFL